MNTQAQEFDVMVRRVHRLPKLYGDESRTYDMYNAEDVVLSRRFGTWKITQVIFKDGSYYNVGQPEQGPHTDDED